MIWEVSHIHVQPHSGEPWDRECATVSEGAFVGAVAYTCTCFRRVESGRVYKRCLYALRKITGKQPENIIFNIYFGSSALALDAGCIKLERLIALRYLTLRTATLW